MKQLLVGVLISTLFNFVYFLVVTTFHDDEIKRLNKKSQKLEEYVDTILIEPMAIPGEVIQAIKERIAKGDAEVR